jgi:hypothetical protein
VLFKSLSNTNSKYPEISYGITLQITSKKSLRFFLLKVEIRNCDFTVRNAPFLYRISRYTGVPLRTVLSKESFNISYQRLPLILLQRDTENISSAPVYGEFCHDISALKF